MSTDLFDVPDAYREALAVFEALRRLGFDADDIFFQCGLPAPELVPSVVPAGLNIVRVILRTTGQEFVVDVGLLRQGEVADAFEETMRGFMVAIVEGRLTPDELQRVWKESDIGASVEKFATLTLLLQQKGFLVPALLDHVPSSFDAPCPCGGKLTLSEGDETEPPAVLHTVPTCPDFDKRGPTEFVRWLNERGRN